jgi:hypothetical protein
MTLPLGKGFKGAGVPLTTPVKVPDDVQKAVADKVECAK